jgi:hypothetical protein
MDSVRVLNSYKTIDELSKTWDSELFKDRKQPTEISKITINPESYSIAYISYVSPDDEYHQYQAEVGEDNLIQNYKDEMLNIVDVSKTSDVCNVYSKKVDHVIGGIPLYIELTESYLKSIDAVGPCLLATIRYKTNHVSGTIYTMNGTHRKNKSYMFVFSKDQTMALNAGESLEFWVEVLTTDKDNLKHVKMCSLSTVVTVLPRISYITVGTYGIDTVVHRNSTLAVRFFTDAINNMSINKQPGLYRGVIITPQIQFWYSFDEGDTFQYVDLCVKSDGFIQSGYVANYMPYNFVAMLTLGNVVVPINANRMVFFFKVIDYGFGSVYFSNNGTNFVVQLS